MINNKQKILAGIFGTATLVVLALVVVRVSNLQTVLQRPKASSGTNCDAAFNAYIPEPQTVNRGQTIVFNYTGSTAYTGITMSNNTGISQGGGAGLDIPSCQVLKATCSETNPYDSNHCWWRVSCKVAQGAGDDGWYYARLTTSEGCIVDVGYHIISCTGITPSVSPSSVKTSSPITFSFTSTYPYTNVNLNTGGGATCNPVSVAGSYTWTYSCTSSATVGSYTATFSSADLPGCSTSQINYAVYSGGGTGYTAISPVGITTPSLTPIFTWSGTMPSNNNYQNICIGTWTGSSSCDSVGCFSTGTSGANSYTSTVALSPNTAYGWLVYSAYSPGTSNVTGMTGGCQQFRTPAAVCTGCLLNGACQTGNTSTACGTGGGTCTVCNSTNGTATCSNGTCGINCNSGYGNCDGYTANGCEIPLGTTTNCAFCGNACTTGQTCTNGSCSGSTIAHECEACGGTTGKTCVNGLNCRMPTSGNGICVSGSSKCGSCDVDSSCTSPLMCIID